MSDKALSILKKAKLEKSSQLELRDCELSNKSIDVFKELEQFLWLEVLMIISTEISDISFIGALKNLKYLYLPNNKIKKLEVLQELKQLRILDLSYNSISDMGDFQKMSKLNYLFAIGNQIEDISPLKEQQELIQLNLSTNKIFDISAISNLKNLKNLNLSHNSISDIAPLQKNSKLEKLDLSFNQIISVSTLENLDNLSSIYLQNNLVADISPLMKFFDESLIVFEESNMLQDNVINIYNNPLINPPLSIARMGSSAITTYVRQLKTQGGGISLYEAKLLIVGEPGAGKTTLSQKLLDQNFKVPNEITKSTIGINVYKGWQFQHLDKKQISFKTNIWDFGGQEIQYMTHQFFLTPSSLYVLIADDRKQHTNFQYWFDAVQLFGKEGSQQSPIIVVLNENNHKSISNFDLNVYKKRFPYLQINVCEVDFSINDERFESLVSNMKKLLINLPHVGYQLPSHWVSVRKRLEFESEKSNHINLGTYKKICIENGVESIEDQLVLSSYLHKLGTILHFQHDHNLRDFIILNPTWAVKAVYAVLENTEVKKNGGKFDWSFLDIIWSNYSAEEQTKLLSLMKKDNFEVCYQISEKEFIAPQLLTNIEPDYEWNSSSSLKYKLVYKFMPKGVLTRLIVRLNEYIYTDGNNNKLVWQKGVILEKKECHALILEEDEEKSILIEITGEPYKRKNFMQWIREEIDTIHKKWYANVLVERLIPCVCNDCSKSKFPNYYNFIHLQNRIEKGKQTMSCGLSGDDVYIENLIDGIFFSTERKSEFENHIIRQLNMLNKGQNLILNNTDLILEKFSFTNEIKKELSIIVNTLKNSTITQYSSEKLLKKIESICEEIMQLNPVKETEKIYKELQNEKKGYFDAKVSLEATLPIVPHLLEAKFEASLDVLQLFRSKKDELLALWNQIRQGYYF